MMISRCPLQVLIIASGVPMPAALGSPAGPKIPSARRKISVRRGLFVLGAGFVFNLFVWLPEEKVVVTGDLVVHPIPYAFAAPMRAPANAFTPCRRPLIAFSFISTACTGLRNGHPRPIPLWP